MQITSMIEPIFRKEDKIEMFINNKGIECFECVDCNQMRWDEDKESYICRHTGYKVEPGHEPCDRIDYLKGERISN